MKSRKVSTRRQPWRKALKKKIQLVLRSPIVYRWSVLLLHIANRVFDVFYKN